MSPREKSGPYGWAKIVIRAFPRRLDSKLIKLPARYFPRKLTFQCFDVHTARHGAFSHCHGHKHVYYLGRWGQGVILLTLGCEWVSMRHSNSSSIVKIVCTSALSPKFESLGRDFIGFAVGRIDGGRATTAWHAAWHLLS